MTALDLRKFWRIWGVKGALWGKMELMIEDRGLTLSAEGPEFGSFGSGVVAAGAANGRIESFIVTILTDETGVKDQQSEAVANQN